MEYAKEEKEHVRYDASLDKLKLQSRRRITRVFDVLKRHKLMTTAFISFILFSCINVYMIYSFMSIFAKNL